MAKQIQVPTLQQIQRGLMGSENARERMHEVLWKLKYGGPKQNLSFSRGLLELALLPEIDEKGRQRLVVASASHESLAPAYQKVFDMCESSWVRAAVLDSLSNTVCDEYFEMLRSHTPKGSATRSIRRAYSVVGRQGQGA